MAGMLRKRDNQGASLLFVLAALLFVGFISSSMIKMSTGDSVSNRYYSTSASAQSAAKSGLYSAILQLEAPELVKSRTIPLLTSWLHSRTGKDIPEKYKWLAGSEHAFDTIEGTSLQYRTQMIAFDPRNYAVTLKSEGIGNAGSRTTIVSSYILKGLEIGTPPVISLLPENALHLGGGAGEITVTMNIHGGFYLKGGGRCVTQKLPTPGNADAEFINVYGNFYLDSTKDSTFLIKKTNFHNSVYLGGNATFQARRNAGYNKPEPAPTAENFQRLRINGKLGIMKDLELLGQGFGLEVAGHLYSNARVEGSGTTGSIRTATEASYHFNGDPYYADSIILNPDSRLYLDKDIEIDAGTSDKHSTDYREVFGDHKSISIVDELNVLDSLHMTTPPKLSFNIDKILSDPSVVVHDVKFNKHNGAAMNALCNSIPDSHKYLDTAGNSWTVVRYNGAKGGGANAFVAGVDTTEFSDRIIILVDQKSMGGLATKIYNHKAVGSFGNESSNTTGGTTIVYVSDGYKISGFGGPNTFRGLIYSKSDQKNIYRCTTGGKILGGIYQTVESEGIFRLEGRSLEADATPTNYSDDTLHFEQTFDIYYDKGVMEELKNLDVFSDGTGEDTDPETSLSLMAGYKSPVSELISQYL